ncbi:MAG: hypothetical protein RL757_3369 [Bacteroidota bacterium]|jgi:hypothetical protein
MNSWQSLLKTALLGTARATIALDELPNPVRQKILDAPAADPETELLRAAALLWNYRRAGNVAKPVAKLHIAPASPESWKIAPPQYPTTFRQILNEKNINFELFELLFDKMIAQNLIFAPAYIFDVLKLLDISNGVAKGVSFRKKIVEVTGERGAWLLQFNKKWQKYFVSDAQHTWLEGTNAQRNELFVQWTQFEPQRAIAQLKADWQNETPKTRRDWLQFFFDRNVNQPVLTDELPFFETLYNDFQVNGDFKKEIVKSQVAVLRQILLSLPNSVLFAQTVAALKKYVHAEKKMLGLMNQTKLLLPIADDDFFNPQTMQKTYASAEKSLIPQWSDAHFWFNMLLTDLHPSAWEQVLGDDWTAIFKVFEQTFGRDKEKNNLVRIALANALARHQHERGVRVFLEKNEVLQGDWSLFNVLTNAELEEKMLKIDFSNPATARNAALRNGWKWSKPFSRHILKGITNPEIEAYLHITFAMSAFSNFDLSVINDLYDLSMRPDNNNWRDQQRRAQIVLPLLRLLELRQQIENL